MGAAPRKKDVFNLEFDVESCAICESSIFRLRAVARFGESTIHSILQNTEDLRSHSTEYSLQDKYIPYSLPN